MVSPHRFYGSGAFTAALSVSPSTLTNRKRVATTSVLLVVGFVFGIFFPMSRVHRLRAADRIFFVTVNLRRSLTRFTAAEDALILEGA